MRLFRPDDPGHEFDGLTRIIFYIVFLIDFFFNRFALYKVISIL